MRSAFGLKTSKTRREKMDMSNLKKLISTTSYDKWIAWSYAIISLLAIVAMYGLSTHVDAGASETIASLQAPGP